MSVYLELGLAMIVGCLLGWVQFRGLWETLRRLPEQRFSGFWLMASFLLRTAVVLVGFGILARQGGWPAVLAALGGMLLVRSYLIRQLRPPNISGTREIEP